MTRKRISEDHSVHISQKCATMLHVVEIAQRVINVKRLTIEWKNSITLISTRQSSVHPILMLLVSVSTVTIAHLLTVNQRSQLSLLISLKRTQISTCFTSRQYGALIMKITIRETNACLHITGRILGGNHSFISMIKTNVQIGALVNSLTTTKMDVQMSIDACRVMAGKSKNTTLKTTSSIPVSMVNSATSLTALTFIMTMTRDRFLHNGSKFSLKLGPLRFHQTTICLI